MHIPEIIQVKETFNVASSSGYVTRWELPYENLLTRRSAAIFFFDPSDKSNSLANVTELLSKFENFSIRANVERKLSMLQYRVTFSKEEKEKNEAIALNAVPAK